MGIIDSLFKSLSKKKEERLEFQNELGSFSFDTNVNWYEGSIDWLDEKCNVYLNTDSDEKEIIEKYMEILRQLCSSTENWDKMVREFASKELTNLANEWQQEEDKEAEKITEEVFRKRMIIDSIVIFDDGEVEFYFGDDDMFWGHTIVVYGNISGELDRADIAG